MEYDKKIIFYIKMFTNLITNITPFCISYSRVAPF